MNKAALILRLIAFGILLQTLFFKFSAAPESVAIFTQLGVEPWGRITTGLIELVVAILMLISRTKTIGALAAAGLMGGAILSHIFVLGIEVNGDGGLLFVLACITATFSLASIWMHVRSSRITLLKALWNH